MLKKIQISLFTILAIALIATALHSTATAQAIDFVVTSPTTARASSDGCEEKLAIALQRLEKTLDAFEKSQKALGFAVEQIDAMKKLDALKTELLAAKDQYIADVLADNKFLRETRNSTKSRIRKVFETIEKIALVAAGVYLGRR